MPLCQKCIDKAEWHTRSGHGYHGGLKATEFGQKCDRCGRIINGSANIKCELCGKKIDERAGTWHRKHMICHACANYYSFKELDEEFARKKNPPEGYTEVGRCVDKAGRVSELYTRNGKYYRNPTDPFKIYTEKPNWRELTKEEQTAVHKKFGSKLRCSFAFDTRAKTKKLGGFFCYTHRARSKGCEAPNKIPVKDYKFICSTG